MTLSFGVSPYAKQCVFNFLRTFLKEVISPLPCGLRSRVNRKICHHAHDEGGQAQAKPHGDYRKVLVMGV